MKVNDRLLVGYVDLGSQCTLIRHNIAMELNLKWSQNNLPNLRGLGNNLILPLGKTEVKINIQNICETIEVLIVSDNVISYPILVGHSFTEKLILFLLKRHKVYILQDVVAKSYVYFRTAI